MCPYVCPVCQGGDVPRAEGLAAVFEDDADDGGTPSSWPHSDEDPKDAALEKEKSWESREPADAPAAAGEKKRKRFVSDDDEEAPSSPKESREPADAPAAAKKRKRVVSDDDEEAPSSPKLPKLPSAVEKEKSEECEVNDNNNKHAPRGDDDAFYLFLCDSLPAP